MERIAVADLSAIIVNYNSGWFCANLADSLLDQAFTTPKGRRGKIEIIVIDNASPQDQRSLLDPLRDRGVKVVYSDENLGYSGGSNLGMRHATSDWVLIANPDVVLMPGSLNRMLEAIYADSKTGMVGPQGFLDPGFHYYLPPVEWTTLKGHLMETAARIFQPMARRYSRARSRYAIRYWTGEGALKADVICGYCFIMPAALARRLGPFDPAFPLYYEDSDLSFRVAREGYSLKFVTGTPVVHFYNKSAGPVFDEVIQKYDRSKSYFFQKHHGPLRHLLYRKSTDYLKKNMGRLEGSYFQRFDDLGGRAEAPVFDLPLDHPVMVELTLDRAFVMAVGHPHPGGPYRIPDSTWDVLEPTSYFLRILDPASLQTLMACTWEKTSPAKRPPAYAELKARLS